jgi:pimeloyl-ACP methyl ester carboxylesterase
MSASNHHHYYQPTEKFFEADGVTLCYEDLGDPGAEPLLLIMGLASQLTAWPPEFLEPLLAAGYRVIRFDNRDIGHSSEVDCRVRISPPVAFVRSKIGLKVDAAYTLQDMACDARALLTSLNIRDAHVLGISMGGMIAQLIAADPELSVASLTLMMTSDNHPKLPMPDINTLWRLNGSGIRGHDLEAALKRGVAFWDCVASPAYPTPHDRVLQRIARDYQRSYRPAGIVRQMRAIMATGSIEEWSRRVKAPTLILHGADDPLVKIQAAHRLKENIPHAKLDIIHGWGHDLPLPLLPKLAHKVIDHLQANRNL